MWLRWEKQETHIEFRRELHRKHFKYTQRWRNIDMYLRKIGFGNVVSVKLA
jgi:hypothetical protein